MIVAIACGETEAAPGQTVSGIASSHVYSFTVPETWENSGTEQIPIYVLREKDEVARLVFGGVGRPSVTLAERCEDVAASGWGEAVLLEEVRREDAYGDVVRCQGKRPGGMLEARFTLASEPDDVWGMRLLAWGDGAVITDYEPVLDEAIRTLEIGTLE